MTKKQGGGDVMSRDGVLGGGRGGVRDQRKGERESWMRGQRAMPWEGLFIIGG